MLSSLNVSSSHFPFLFFLTEDWDISGGEESGKKRGEKEETRFVKERESCGSLVVYVRICRRLQDIGRVRHIIVDLAYASKLSLLVLPFYHCIVTYWPEAFQWGGGEGGSVLRVIQALLSERVASKGRGGNQEEVCFLESYVGVCRGAQWGDTCPESSESLCSDLLKVITERPCQLKDEVAHDAIKAIELLLWCKGYKWMKEKVWGLPDLRRVDDERCLRFWALCAYRIVEAEILEKSEEDNVREWLLGTFNHVLSERKEGGEESLVKFRRSLWAAYGLISLPGRSWEEVWNVLEWVASVDMERRSSLPLPFLRKVRIRRSSKVCVSVSIMSSMGG